MHHQQPIDTFLAQLDGVRERGKGGWMAKCPAHDDSTASLTVKQTDDGRVLCRCWAGCSFASIVAAVGLEMRDMFPPKTNDERQAFVRAAKTVGAWRALGQELLIYAMIGDDEVAERARRRIIVGADTLYHHVAPSAMSPVMAAFKLHTAIQSRLAAFTERQPESGMYLPDSLRRTMLTPYEVEYPMMARVKAEIMRHQNDDERTKSAG